MRQDIAARRACIIAALNGPDAKSRLDARIRIILVSLTKEQVQHIATLARLEIAEDDGLRRRGRKTVQYRGFCRSAAGSADR